MINLDELVHYEKYDYPYAFVKKKPEIGALIQRSPFALINTGFIWKCYVYGNGIILSHKACDDLVKIFINRVLFAGLFPLIGKKLVIYDAGLVLASVDKETGKPKPSMLFPEDLKKLFCLAVLEPTDFELTGRYVTNNHNMLFPIWGNALISEVVRKEVGFAFVFSPEDKLSVLLKISSNNKFKPFELEIKLEHNLYYIRNILQHIFNQYLIGLEIQDSDTEIKLEKFYFLSDLTMILFLQTILHQTLNYFNPNPYLVGDQFFKVVVKSKPKELEIRVFNEQGGFLFSYVRKTSHKKENKKNRFLLKRELERLGFKMKPKENTAHPNADLYKIKNLEIWGILTFLSNQRYVGKKLIFNSLV